MAHGTAHGKTHWDNPKAQAQNSKKAEAHTAHHRDAASNPAHGGHSMHTNLAQRILLSGNDFYSRKRRDGLKYDHAMTLAGQVASGNRSPEVYAALRMLGYRPRDYENYQRRPRHVKQQPAHLEAEEHGI